jgi:hypothetical protein
MDLYRKPDDTKQESETLPRGKAPSVVSNDTEEVPYLDYQSAHAKPYTVEYFGLGDTWRDPEGGYPKEIELLEGYIKDKIDSGELPNSVKAVGNRIKEIEKVNNLKNEERAVVKIGVITAYVKFLMETDGIKSNLKKYR